MALDNENKNLFDVVGTRPIRPDGIEKVTGQARFGADAYLPGMLHGIILRSPHAHAEILNIDTTLLDNDPSVKAIVTRKDFSPDLKGEDWNILENVMADQKALYDGHAIAAVACSSLLEARDAVKKIRNNKRTDKFIIKRKTDKKARLEV